MSISRCVWGSTLPFFHRGGPLMETQNAIEPKLSNVPACSTLEFRVEFAGAIAALVDRVAFQLRLDDESSLRIRAALIQKIVHRVARCSIANVRSAEVLHRVQ